MEKKQVMTANRLRDGEVVYLTKEDSWAEDIGLAAIAVTDLEVAHLNSIADKAVEDRFVVAPYLFDVLVDEGGIQPVSTRERIRAAGPTVRVDLGKQARA